MANLKDNLANKFEDALHAAREGEHEELGNLLNFYRDYLLTFATKKLSRALAIKNAPSDLVQETLMKASKEFRSFSGVTESELQMWLKRILTRKLVDTYRYYQVSKIREISREVPLSQSAIPANRDTESEPPIFSADKLEALSRVLNRLDREQQQIIQLQLFEKKSFEEIGLQFERSTEAARKMWARAILRLAKEFRADDSRTRTGT